MGTAGVCGAVATIFPTETMVDAFRYFFLDTKRSLVLLARLGVTKNHGCATFPGTGNNAASFCFCALQFLCNLILLCGRSAIAAHVVPAINAFFAFVVIADGKRPKTDRTIFVGYFGVCLHVVALSAASATSKTINFGVSC